MDANTRRQLKAIEKLRLPELQARFADIVGEQSRSPNRVFLLRRIAAALEAQAAAAAAAAAAGETVVTSAASALSPYPSPTNEAMRDATAAGAARIMSSSPRRPGRPSRRDAASNASRRGRPRNRAAAGSDDLVGAPRLTQLSIAELQVKYAEVIGRPTNSQHSGYLIWKIRQAERGRIRVGPARQRSSDNPADMKVLPLRMETSVVDQLDAARQRLGLVSRTDLFRRALQLYLKKAGEPEVAALFAAEAEA